MNKVKITVFIPVFNMADTIERAILSVLNQDYENKELIVLDGGSTDGTVEVVKKYLDRIAYFTSGPDGGSSKAIATNLVHAMGEIIGMIGADDWYNPGALSEAARAYEETRADVLYGDVMIRKPDGTSLWSSYANVDLEKMYVCCAIFTIASFVKSDLLAEHYRHYFSNHEGELKLATDHYLWLRLYRAGRRFAYIEAEQPISNFSFTGATSRQIYRVLKESEQVLALAAGPENAENKTYYQAMERHFASHCVPLYLELIEKGFLTAGRQTVGDKSKDYILFGAGDFGKKFSMLLPFCGCQIRYVVDNSPERIGGFCGGNPIRSPESLLAERDIILLISTINYNEEIYQQIQEMHLDSSITVMTHDDFSFEVYRILGRKILDEAWEKGVIQ